MTTATPDPSKSAALPFRAAWSLGTLVKVLVSLVLFVGLALALQGGWERLGEYRWQFEPWAVGLSLLAMIAASIWNAMCWRAVSHAFGARLGIRPSLRVYSWSNLGKYLPGKVWHAFARVYMAQQEGVPLAAATASVLTDAMLNVAAAALVVVLALPTIVSALTDLDGALVTGIGLVGVMATLALLHPSALNLIFQVAERVMPRRSFPRIGVGYGTILAIFVLYVLLWGMYAAALFAGIQAVHPISSATFPTLSAILTFSYLAGLVMPLAPAGLGVREGLMALLLSQLIPLPWPAAAAASVLVRVLQIAAEGLCAALFSRL